MEMCKHIHTCTKTRKDCSDDCFEPDGREYKCLAKIDEATNPPVPQVCSKVLLNDETCRRLILVGYKQGYEAGHNDTVESMYGDAEECGKDWLADALEDGTFEGI